MSDSSGADSTGDPPSATATRGVEVAVSAAHDLGLEVSAPAVLHDGFNVLVHLAPSPVVVRVVQASDLRPIDGAWQQRELDVTGWLSDRGAAVVPPSPLVPRRPVHAQDRVLTFWQHVEQVPAEFDAVSASARVAPLHAALRDYPGELPVMASAANDVRGGLALLAADPGLRERGGLTAADLDRALDERRRLAPVMTDPAGVWPDAPLQAIHGDSPVWNQIPTPDGVLVGDFEDVAWGPVEWDLAFCGEDGAAAYAQAGGSLDPARLRVVESLRWLQVVACLAQADVLPDLAETLAPVVDLWRASEPAAGFGA